MIKTLGWVFLAIFCGARSAASSPVVESWSGDWNGAAYRVAPSSPTHLGSIAWNPESGEVPLTIKDAVQAARASLARMVGDGLAHFQCDEIQLRAIGGHGRWAYVVQFASDHPSQRMPAGGGNARASLPFLVY